MTSFPPLWRGWSGSPSARPIPRRILVPLFFDIRRDEAEREYEPTATQQNRLNEEQARRQRSRRLSVDTGEIIIPPKRLAFDSSPPELL